MTPRPSHTPPRPASRRGFSLIELMVVIVVISILVGLLLAAVGAGRTTVQEAAVAAEIKALETGIAQFRDQFGMDPPSFIILYEARETSSNTRNWATDSELPSQRAQSRALIQRIWPQFNFDLDRDLNKNGNSTDRIILTGDECLLFFLGGVDTINVDSTAVAARGFSANPTDPFASASDPSGANRIGPFGEFDPDRMIDYEESIGPSSGDAIEGGVNDGAHSYAHNLPSVQVPFLYFSSYGGQGYRAQSDGNLNQSFDNMGKATIQPGVELGAVYFQSPGVPWKEQSFQIISAGFDGSYGVGGQWSKSNGLTGTGIEKDRDNITNFSGGTLE